MSQAKHNPYQSPVFQQVAKDAQVAERMAFLRNTYLHLALAIGALILIEFVAFSLFWTQIESFAMKMTGGYMWLVVLGAFMGVSWLAESWANSDTSKGMQYAGLALYVLAEAVILMPLLYIAQKFGGDGLILSAGIVTMIIFSGLTLFVFVTRVDFSFLRTGLMLAGFGAMGLIVVSIFVPQLPIMGKIFSVAMIVFASGYILYHTSNVLHHYRTDQYVAAALSLFASVALLFWYVLQLLLALQSD